tara:strand:- start:4163 stop:4372 length:210 start_codon:yes stop_codon:yes gene_type:complete
MFGLDPLMSTLILTGAIFYCAYMIGRGDKIKDRDEIINTTMVYLCKSGYVKWRYDENGEIEMVPINENL